MNEVDAERDCATPEGEEEEEKEEGGGGERGKEEEEEGGEEEETQCTSGLMTSGQKPEDAPQTHLPDAACQTQLHYRLHSLCSRDAPFLYGLVC